MKRVERLMIFAKPPLAAVVGVVAGPAIAGPLMKLPIRDGVTGEGSRNTGDWAGEPAERVEMERADSENNIVQYLGDRAPTSRYASFDQAASAPHIVRELQ